VDQAGVDQQAVEAAGFGASFGECPGTRLVMTQS